jgi:hypothetical protein
MKTPKLSDEEIKEMLRLYPPSMQEKQKQEEKES